MINPRQGPSYDSAENRNNIHGINLSKPMKFELLKIVLNT